MRNNLKQNIYFTTTTTHPRFTVTWAARYYRYIDETPSFEIAVKSKRFMPSTWNSGLDMPEYHIFTLYYNNDDILISIILFDFMDKENGRSTIDTNMIQCLNPAL